MNGVQGIIPIGDGTRRGQIVSVLRRLIVSGDVDPGQRLTETDLAKRLGVSRAPLREAIRELVESGLVEVIPYKGLFVRRLTTDDLNDLYALRLALEQLAFRQLWDKRTKASLTDLDNRHDALVAAIGSNSDPDAAIALELHLHSWCYEQSGNRLLLRNWEQMKPNLQMYFTMHQKAHARPGPSRAAHNVYVDLAKGDDLGAIQDHLVDHMRQGLNTTMKAMKSLEKPPV